MTGIRVSIRRPNSYGTPFAPEDEVLTAARKEEFESTRRYARLGVQLWRSGGVQSDAEDVDTPVVSCLCHRAHSEWHLGESTSSLTAMAEAILLVHLVH
jgi:hypothetical protein